MADRALQPPQVASLLFYAEEKFGVAGPFDSVTKIEEIIKRARTTESIAAAVEWLTWMWGERQLRKISVRDLNGRGWGGKGLVDLVLYKRDLLRCLQRRVEMDKMEHEIWKVTAAMATPLQREALLTGRHSLDELAKQTSDPLALVSGGPSASASGSCSDPLPLQTLFADEAPAAALADTQWKAFLPKSGRLVAKIIDGIYSAEWNSSFYAALRKVSPAEDALKAGGPLATAWEEVATQVAEETKKQATDRPAPAASSASEAVPHATSAGNHPRGRSEGYGSAGGRGGGRQAREVLQAGPGAPVREREACPGRLFRGGHG